MEHLRIKTELALAHVNLQRAESNVRRNTPLYRDKLVSEDIYELSVSARDLYKTEITEKSNAVVMLERRLEELGSFGTLQAPSTNQLLAAELAKLESSYTTASSNWAPITLIAPIDGMVNSIYRQERENVVEGEPLIGINSSWSDRIVGYLRQPYRAEPIVGMKVLIITRERKRRKYWSEITHIGAQVEVITNALAFVQQGALVDAGLPITVNLPSGLQIRPGEIVDLMIQSKTSVGMMFNQPRAELSSQ
jgi:multidrug resistance efflux pump